MVLLSQIIGHAQDSKKRVKALMTQVYHTLQKAVDDALAEANASTVQVRRDGGTELVQYIFQDVLP